METIERTNFITWAAKAGILPSTGSSPEQELFFHGAQNVRKFWTTPRHSNDLPGFVSTLMTATSTTGSFTLSLRGGSAWFTGAEFVQSPIQDQLRDRILGTIPIPKQFNGALRFPESEWRDVLMIVVTMLTYGWRISDDLEVVGEDRSAVFITSHHGYVMVQAKDENRLKQFEDAMLAAHFQPAPDSIYSPE